MKLPAATKKIISQTTMAWCASIIIFSMGIPAVAEWYMQNIYPLISSILIHVSQWFPCSLYDILWTSSILYLIIVVGIAIASKPKRKTYLKNVITFLAWIIIAFYLCWGISYFRPNHYSRKDIPKREISATQYIAFSKKYIQEINSLSNTVIDTDTDSIINIISAKYNLLFHPKDKIDRTLIKPKYMLYSSGMASMGIKGYIGAYFSEPTLNSLLTTNDFPFTYAHELAHVHGISSEAEANYYAFRVCNSTNDTLIRYSAHLALLPHLLNGMEQLSTTERKNLFSLLSTKITDDYTSRYEYWKGLYSPTIGEIQGYLYDLFLKGNKISSGTQNYASVIEYLIHDERE